MTAYFAIPKSASKVKRQRMMCGEIHPAKKPDIDSVCKVVADALNGVACRKVAVFGELRTRNYEKDGRKVYITEVMANDVEFLTPRSQPAEVTETQQPEYQPDEHGFIQVDDESLPF